MKKYTILLAVSLFAFSAEAQNIPTLHASEILHNLKKLNTLGSVLYVAAHPDDENTRLLAYLANEKRFRTAYLSLTRGDGGQNLIGKEQGEPLGLIRTQELLAARRTDGAEQFFTRANDFGYSKTPEETFSIWNKEIILADVVFAIRKFKPDVIICRFPTTGEGGHGHHTASAMLALEAFQAAADPKRFPEQLQYTQTWQSKRIFWNTFNFGTTNTTAANQIKIDVGGFNPLLGKNYGEMAAESRSMHKSQGFGSARQRGSTVEYFKLLKGDSLKNGSNDIFEGINTHWNRLEATQSIQIIQELLDNCIKKYNPENPENSLSDLVALYKQIQNLKDNNANTVYWKQQKLKELQTLLLACAGVWAEASSPDYMGVVGQEVSITAQILGRNNAKLMLRKIQFFQKTDTTTAITLKNNELYTFRHKEKLEKSENTSNDIFSNPYWLNEKHEIGIYSIKNPLLVGMPENEPFTKVVFDLQILDLNLKVERNLVYKATDPVKGEVYRPFEVLPPASVNISEKTFAFVDATPKTIQIVVKANMPQVSGVLQLNASDGWKVFIKNPAFKLSNKGDEIIIEASITANKNTKNGKLQASIFIDNTLYNKAIQRIEYDHIPYQFILTDAEANLINLDLKKTGVYIGYIVGAGDDVPASLKQIGYDVTLLTDELLTNENLSKYDAIVTGVRAYNTNERLQVHYNKLMEYVNNGGNLVVQYNTNSRIGPVVAKIAPYPFSISRDRVTDEKAPMKILKNDHSVLNFPNKITPQDFEGWVQERGIYFANDLDKQYETIFVLNDANEKASEGSLIVAKYGKGNFVYTGLAFFRQLPAGVSGSFRLFANILSLPKNKVKK